VAAGLHLVAHLPPGLDEPALIAAVARRGVAVHGLAPYRLSHPGRPGLVLGYATLDEQAVERGVGLLAEACREVRLTPRARR
jgi:GntR family transcriptional regulator/MocR family aminotransferase